MLKDLKVSTCSSKASISEAVFWNSIHMKTFFQALEDGFVDAVIVNRNYGDKYIKDHPVRKTMMMMSPYILTFAFYKESHVTRTLSRRIDHHMENMMYDNDSVYYELLDKYFEEPVAEKLIIVMPKWFKIFLLQLWLCQELSCSFSYHIHVCRSGVKQKNSDTLMKTSSI